MTTNNRIAEINRAVEQIKRDKIRLVEERKERGKRARESSFTWPFLLAWIGFAWFLPWFVIYHLAYKPVRNLVLFWCESNEIEEIRRNCDGKIAKLEREKADIQARNR